MPGTGGSSARALAQTANLDDDDLLLGDSPGPEGGHRGTHAHLWTLADGTGLHAPYGRLVRELETGRVCCHLCGQWFRSLGSHLRRHGYTAMAYREMLGLCRTRPLTSDELSEAVSRRRAEAYRQCPELRSRLAEGRAMAGSGARGAVAHEPSAETVAVRRDALRKGRQTRDRDRNHAVRARLVGLGYTDLGDYLRAAYAAGDSLDDLRMATGLGAHRLQQAMASAGIVVRRPGDTTPSGRRARAVSAERAAAARVGADDITSWLTERYAVGWSLSRLGRTVGHSAHWVRWRLNNAAG